MCYIPQHNGKMLSIPVEKGCLVFAIISAVVALISLLASTIVGVCIVAAGRPDPLRNGYHDMYIRETLESLGYLAAVIFLPIAVCLSLTGFIFSVLLCNGICKRRPNQVMAYYIYGVVSTILAMSAGFLSLLCREYSLGINILIGCVLYSPFIVLVHLTYKKVVALAAFTDHVPLVETRVETNKS